MSLDRARLERLLGGANNERLRRRLRERLVRGGTGAVTLTRVTDAERDTVERLLGRPPRRGQTLRVSPEAVAGTLQRAGIAPDLRTALEALDGPLADPAATRAAEEARWEAVVDTVRERAAALGLEAWLDELTARGLLKRLAGNDPKTGRALLEASLTVIEALPAPGLNRSTLAARWLGDAHGLDRGRPVAALVRHALKRHWRGGIADATPDERTVWAHAGVLIGGDISSTVLVYQLPLHGDSPTTLMLAAQNGAGEPTYLTLRQLLRHDPPWAVAKRPVFVCENPTVVAEAAERLGPGCAPLVATCGRPRAAALVLLEQLRDAGAVLHFRADFDWAGIGIMNGILARLHARPWRMDTATLKRCARMPGRPLEGQPVTAVWDPALSAALQARGSALHEEQLLDDLLADLAG